MNNISKILLIILFCISLLACNNKNSLVGFPGSNINTYEFTLPDSCFDLAYSWGDSIRIFSNNTKLVMGNYDGIEARTLILFNSIPEDITVTGTPTLSIKVSNKEYANIMLVSVSKLNKSWTNNQVSWLNNTSTTTWDNPGGDFTPINSISNVVINSATDTLTINLPTSLIQEWSDNDSLNYGIMLSQNTSRLNEFVEFYSLDTYTIGPKLEFTYLDANNVEKSYSETAYTDAFIHSKTDRVTQIDSNTLSIWNIPAKALTLRFSLPWELFNNAGAVSIQSEADLKNIVVNRADLVLNRNSDNLALTNPKYNVSLYTLNSAIINNPNLFVSTDYTYSAATIDSLKSNKSLMSVNCTKAVQEFVAKKTVNNGIVIKSNYSNMDFSRINFFGLTANDITKRPKITVKFSTLK